MKFSIRFIFGILFFGLVGYFTWNTYSYFFTTTAPILALSGIDQNGCYSGDIRCLVSGKDSYKIATLSIMVDDDTLLDAHPINRSTFEYPFTINTFSLPQGKHTLTIEAIDGSYRKNKKQILSTFYADNTPLQIAFVKPEAEFKVLQGRTLHIQFQANKPLQKAKVHLLAQTFSCFPESKNSLLYECFIPVACEETPKEAILSIEASDTVGNQVTLEHAFRIIPCVFKKQTISVSPEKLREEREATTQHEILEKRLLELVAHSPKEKLWQGKFYAPIEIIRITTPYGTIRTTQERGRYMHKAVDIINAPKSVVWAPQDGIVIIKDCYEFSGNTVVIDHGCGIFSMFYHLDSFADIHVGQFIKQGNPLGTIGKTGYATGYHLHWEMRIDNIPVDPLQWISATF